MEPHCTCASSTHFRVHVSLFSQLCLVKKKTEFSSIEETKTSLSDDSTSVFLVHIRRTVHSTCTRFTSAMSSEKENEDPNPVLLKKRRLSLSRKGRFKTISEDQLTAMSKPSVPNTEKSGKWAIKNLKEWYEDYNSRNPNEMCPEDILSHTCFKEVLDK